MKKHTILASAATALILVSPASAAVFIAKVPDHSSNTGAGTRLNSGLFTNNFWSAGPLPRYSGANGLIGDRFATAADDSRNSGEIAFNINAIPEATTWTMMLGGFVAVGLAMRRRNDIHINFS